MSDRPETESAPRWFVGARDDLTRRGDTSESVFSASVRLLSDGKRVDRPEMPATYDHDVQATSGGSRPSGQTPTPCPSVSSQRDASSPPEVLNDSGWDERRYAICKIDTDGALHREPPDRKFSAGQKRRRRQQSRATLDLYTADANGCRWCPHDSKNIAHAYPAGEEYDSASRTWSHLQRSEPHPNSHVIDFRGFVVDRIKEEDRFVSWASRSCHNCPDGCKLSRLTFQSLELSPPSQTWNGEKFSGGSLGPCPHCQFRGFKCEPEFVNVWRPVGNNVWVLKTVAFGSKEEEAEQITEARDH